MIANGSCRSVTSSRRVAPVRPSRWRSATNRRLPARNCSSAFRAEIIPAYLPHARPALAAHFSIAAGRRWRAALFRGVRDERSEREPEAAARRGRHLEPGRATAWARELRLAERDVVRAIELVDGGPEQHAAVVAERRHDDDLQNIREADLGGHAFLGEQPLDAQTLVIVERDGDVERDALRSCRRLRELVLLAEVIE